MPDTSQFEHLSSGQSFEEVCQILGDPTTLLSSETAQIEPGIPLNALKSDLYEWQNDNGDVIRILFKRNVLNDKVFTPAD